MTNKAIVKTGNLKIGIWFNQNSEQNVQKGPSSKISEKNQPNFHCFPTKIILKLKGGGKKKKVTAKKINRKGKFYLSQPDATSST